MYQLCRAAHGGAFRRGVILVPYSMAVPYVLSMLVLIARFGGALDTSRVRAALATVDGTLQELEEDIESHMSRGLTMLSNAVQNVVDSHDAALKAATGPDVAASGQREGSPSSAEASARPSRPSRA